MGLDHSVLKQIHNKPILTYTTQNIYLTAGGIKETLHWHLDNKSAWLVAGIGIHETNNNCSIVNQSVWKNIFENYSPDNLNKLKGHFAIVKVEDDKVELYTDQLGLRNIYITNIDNNYTFFSTRLDWLSQIKKGSKLDIKRFGSQWLLQHNLSDENVITGIDRLSQSGKAVCKPQSFSFKNKVWTTTFDQNVNIDDVITVLRKNVGFSLEKDKQLSLSLSGGLDSRVLLSLLLSNKDKNWQVHSFGEPGFADNVISKKLSSALNKENFLFKPKLSAEIPGIANLENFVGTTNSTSPISYTMAGHFYSELHQQGKVVIDGAYGELTRRRLHNRLLLFGKSAFINRDIDKIISLLQIPRSPIFNKETIMQMNEGIQNQVPDIFQYLPDISAIGIENWLDLFVLQTKLPNSAGYEQGRIDEQVVNFMPFIQPDFLKLVLNLPVIERKKISLFKRIIDQHKFLKQIPLAKVGIYYNYYWPTYLASAVIKLKRTLGFTIDENYTPRFLRSKSELIQDIFNSREVKSYPLYDIDSISNIVTSFFNGDNNYCTELDWLFTFELWRRQLEKKHNPFK